MHVVVSDSMVPEREGTTRTVVSTTLYDLIAAVGDAIEPGEEDLVVPIVAHLLRAGRAHLLNDGNGETLWDEQASPCLEAEERCVLV